MLSRNDTENFDEIGPGFPQILPAGDDFRPEFEPNRERPLNATRLLRGFSAGMIKPSEIEVTTTPTVDKLPVTAK